MGACDKEGKGGKVMGMVIWVVGDKGDKDEGYKEGDGIGNEGRVQRTMALAARAMAARVAGDQGQQGQ